MKDLVYLAGPIGGLTWDEATKWRDHVASLLNSDRIECRSPLRDFDDGRSLRSSHHVVDGGRLTNEGKDTALPFVELFWRDFADAAEASFILFNFLGAKKQSIGTVCELAWAFAWETPLVVVIDKDNINHNPFLEPMMTNMGAIKTVETLQEGINAVRRHFNLPEYP